MRSHLALVRGGVIAVALLLGAGGAFARKAALAPAKTAKEKDKDDKKDAPKACKTNADCDTGPYECINGTCQAQRPLPPT